MNASTITTPHTYSEWVNILDMLKEKIDDEAILKIIQEGTVVWQPGVAERFSKKLVSVVNSRINDATDKLQKEMSRACGQERAIVQALLALRKELVFLSKVINLPALPDETREQYYQLVISQANSIQQSLEESAKKERSGKLLSIVRNNRVNSFN